MKKLIISLIILTKISLVSCMNNDDPVITELVSYIEKCPFARAKTEELFKKFELHKSLLISFPEMDEFKNHMNKFKIALDIAQPTATEKNNTLDNNYQTFTEEEMESFNIAYAELNNQIDMAILLNSFYKNIKESKAI